MFDTLLFTHGGPLDPWSRHGRRKTAKWHNSREFVNWFMYLYNLYTNMFEWEGMPESVNLRYLENVLFMEGRALFFRDPKMSYMALSASEEKNIDVYGYARFWRAIGINYSESYNLDESVVIRENNAMYPPLFMIERWAEKIADSGRTIDVYSATMKRPWIITTEDEDKVTQKILVDEIQNNEVAVIGERRLSAPTKAYPNPLDGKGLESLWKHKHELEDEVLTWMGINNANTDKKERLITDEVNSNNQLIQLNIDTALDWRKRAAKEINKMFSLSVTVDLKHDYLVADDRNGGDNSGKVYNGTGDNA